MRRSRLPILMYHGLADSPSPITLTPACFERQMAELHACGCRVLPLPQVVEYLAAGLPLPERAVAITFDDGYASVYESAWPILERYGFPATVFLVAGFCGRDNRWPGQPAAIPRLPLLTWAQVAELDRHGITIGNHTLAHAALDGLSAGEVEQQVRGAQEMIQDHVGHAITLFAYPYGRYDQQARDAVARSFAGACSTRLALACPGDDAWALPRVEAAYLIPPSLAGRQWGRAFHAYLALRRRARATANLILGRPWR